MTLPLGLRNRLGELILHAFDDSWAHRTLDALVAFCDSSDGRVGPEAAARLTELGWFEDDGGDGVRLLGAHATHRVALCRRVGAAAGIFRDHARLPDGATLPGQLGRAALLADAGLLFEVHELLEPTWSRAEGPLRVALQGLIQVAVGLHHADHGNRDGAVSLLAEGVAKLRSGGSSLPLETAAWESELTRMLTALRAGTPRPAGSHWPRPRGAYSKETAWRSF